MLLLAEFFYLFPLKPFAGSLRRSLKKETKVYLYDWVEVSQESLRFENLTALHLYKAVQTWRATGAGDIGLFYARDKEKREVDFVITERGKPQCLVECKSADETLSPSLLYFQGKLNTPYAVQLVNKSGISKKTKSDGKTQWVLSADQWLGILP